MSILARFGIPPALVTNHRCLILGSVDPDPLSDQQTLKAADLLRPSFDITLLTHRLNEASWTNFHLTCVTIRVRNMYFREQAKSSLLRHEVSLLYPQVLICHLCSLIAFAA